VSKPSPNGWRDAGGRFVPGNPGGPGNPHAALVARLRAAMLGAVTPDDIHDVLRALVRLAKSGHVPAAREVLDRVLGRGDGLDLLARIQALEMRRQENVSHAGE
jgi:hypothetical protein